MHELLRYNTAGFYTVGTIVAPDGVTPVTSLASAMDNTSTGIRQKKRQVAWGPRLAGFTATAHAEFGEYEATYQAADANVLGFMKWKFINAACAPWEKMFLVVPQEVYDTFILGTDNLTVDLTTAERTAVRASLATLASVSAVESKVDVMDAIIDVIAASLILVRAKTDPMNYPTTGLLGVDLRAENGVPRIGSGVVGDKFRNG